ncbi:MAG: SCP2 sterol-binding domain-containing protein [Candidatus Jordarchaeum sp.]|uniref:SCP2 sterol-binding domain-containing protein n=1 Tax=Candidatus Jordarchaeum sp. TaxID=2823881 RepID=UPI00404A58B4
MVRFPSDAWAKAYMKALNENRAYEDSASDWEGDFLFVLDADDKLKERTAIYIDLYHGKCRDAYVLKAGEEKKTNFVIEAPYSVWVRVIKKELDPVQGLIMGRLKLKGDMAKVMKYTKAAQEMVNTTTAIQSEFL